MRKTRILVILSTMGLKTDYGGKGIASKLIRRTEEGFRKRKIRKVFIRADSSNISS